MPKPSKQNYFKVVHKHHGGFNHDPPFIRWTVEIIEVTPDTDMANFALLTSYRLPDDPLRRNRGGFYDEVLTHDDEDYAVTSLTSMGGDRYVIETEGEEGSW